MSALDINSVSGKMCSPWPGSGLIFRGIRLAAELRETAQSYTRSAREEAKPQRRMKTLVARLASLPVIAALFVLCSAMYGHAQTQYNLVGMYVMTPGWISSGASGTCALPLFAWPTYYTIATPGNPTHNTNINALGPNPTYNGGPGLDQRYTTDTDTYFKHILDDTAAMGVDFIMVDLSNGVGYSCFNASLLELMNVADARFDAGTKTPHIAIWFPNPSSVGEGGAPGDDAWIMTNVVNNPSTGIHRKSYAWMNGKPLVGLWSYHRTDPITHIFYDFLPTTTTETTNDFTVRYICDSDIGDCTQGRVNLGTVWPWSTYGDATPGPLVTPTCPSSASSTQSCPLSSANSNEVTIEQGYQDILGCVDYWRQLNMGQPCPTPPGPNGVGIGFTTSYYTDQWNYAYAAANTLHNPITFPQIVILSTYDEIEGGLIQANDAYVNLSFNGTTYPQGDVYQQMTEHYVTGWKGSLNLYNLGPP